MKKFLALVLAMMMTLSLMITVNAASDFTDVDTITDEFSEAVAVLEGLKVFEGYPDKTFKPKNNITRAEVATIVYRLATGDVKGAQAHLYKDYATFTDVTSDHWAAGYINYCANAEWIAGYGNGKFGPNDSVTGYQAAAMILRAVGYGKNNEFTGSSWQVQVANVTRSQGLLVNVDNTTYANTLNQPATRELIAEILFQAGLIDTVDWTMLLGYQPTGRGSLSQISFKLDVSSICVIDDWGNPGYYWFKGTNTAANRVATIGFEPDATYTETKRECDVAHDLDISTSQSFVLYVNDEEPVTNNYLVVSTDTVTKVGGQGRLTKVYDDLSHPHIANNTWPATVTMVDTFLAQVTGVSNAVLDAAGHVIVPAKLTLAIYDDTTLGNPSSPRVVSKKTTDATNWEYSKGDMILLNAWTDHDGTQDSDTALTLHTGANAEKAAFETEQVELKDSAPLKEVTNPTTQVTDVAYAEVLGKAEARVAKQTVVYWNQEKHNVDGTDIPDQLNLVLDVAGTTTNSDFTWYFDQYGNIIGIGEAIKSNYGVITSIYSSFSTADGATDGKAVAKAHVKYSDGTEGDITIDQFLTSTAASLGGHGTPNASMQVNTTTPAVTADNSARLFPIYDYSYDGTDTMKADTPSVNWTASTDVEQDGQLFVAPVASVNKNAEDGNAAGYYGVIEGNLFKFVTSGDGTMTAIEVAGDDANNGAFVGNYNDLVDNAAGVDLKKNAGFLTLENETVRLDNNTQIVLKEGTKINTYNGLSALPGDVHIADDVEVDWADYDGNGFADVLYTTATVKGTVTYGLFYYNGGAAQWTGGDKTGTIAGYLNGEAKTLTFDNQTEFNHVLNSMSAPVYAGHLFAVEVTNDVVTNLMADSTAADPKEQFLKTAGTAVTVDDLDLNTGVTSGNFTASATNDFVVGVTGGNVYTATTKAVWFHDDNVAPATTATYNAGNGTITTNATVYYLTGVSKVIGNDLSYLNRADYTNDITIVYDTVGTMNTITEIYVTTLPDITPGGTTVTFGDDITKAPTGLADGTALSNWLKGFRTGVFYCTDNKTGTTAASEATMLYFPFVTSADDTPATLEIKDSAGNMRFVESATVATAGNHFFSFDFVNAVPGTGNGGGWSGTTGLGVGTYSYAIYVNGTTLVSSGTFTLVVA